MAQEKILHVEVERQLQALAFEPDRPLIIADADEVLVAFMAGLERYLEANGLFFDWASYALTGNIKRREDEVALEHEDVQQLLLGFFDRHAHELDPVPGAAKALEALAERCQIVVLTNVPSAHREARQRSLSESGMDYPVIANIGSKGPPVRFMADRVQAPIVFLDDIPRNHSSVARDAEKVHRVHFVADPRLARLLGPAEDSHYRSDDWRDAGAYIDRFLAAAGF